MATVVDGDKKAAFSFPTSRSCRVTILFSTECPLRCSLFAKAVSSNIFLIFGVTWSGIELQYSWSLMNTLSTWKNVYIWKIN